jgi:primosomal protein N' (replication factor Y) (superfamily II helicase)
MPPDSATRQFAEVLLPFSLKGAYTYEVPEGMVVEAGDFVEVPLGPRARIGVVWALKLESGTNKQLRAITQRFANPPLTATHRKFIEWLSAYYLENPGNVLRMVLRVPSVLGDARETIAYRIGATAPKKLTPQRARVLELAREGFAMSARDLANAAGVGTSVIKALAKDGALEEITLPA